MFQKGPSAAQAFRPYSGGFWTFNSLRSPNAVGAASHRCIDGSGGGAWRTVGGFPGVRRGERIRCRLFCACSFFLFIKWGTRYSSFFFFFFFFRGMLWHVVCNFPRYERSWVQVNISPIEVRFDFSAEGLCFELIMHHAPPQRVVWVDICKLLKTQQTCWV